MKKISKNEAGNITEYAKRFNEQAMREEWFQVKGPFDRYPPAEIFRPLKWRLETVMSQVDITVELRNESYGIKL